MAYGFAVAANTSPEVLRASAREAERLGYGSFWVNHPGPIDGLGALAVAAGETTRIELGVGVIPLHTRGPDSVVEGVRLHALPLDRLLLGVGSPNPRALARVREAVTTIRSRITARIVVAALGPRMCHLAGEIADGVLFNWLTPDHARRSAEWVRAGAAAVGRQPPRLLAYVRLALGTAAGARLEEEGTRYAAIPAYGAHFERMGVKPAETAIAAADPEALRRALAQWEGVIDAVILRAITGGDTVDEHLTLLAAAKRA